VHEPGRGQQVRVSGLIGDEHKPAMLGCGRQDLRLRIAGVPLDPPGDAGGE
jgi:hypothetical protein